MAGILLVSIIFVTWFLVAYLSSMGAHYDRVRMKGNVIESPYGGIEYTEQGSGQAVLVIHGSGGGYDQGELIAGTLLSEKYRSIIPSRFGYLRSSLPASATWDEQADAYAFLLDRLGLDQVAVVAMSQGGPSALLFALLHPNRVSSLTLVSCGAASSSAPGQEQANRKGELLTSLFRYDLPYWTFSKLFKRQFLRLLGASENVISGLTPEQLGLTDRIVDEMNPASLRSAGVAFDNKAQMPGRRISAVAAPTLVIHARDDSLQLFHNARFAASSIPGAELLAFDRGGHLVMIVEQNAIRRAVQEHIDTHASRPSPSG